MIRVMESDPIWFAFGSRIEDRQFGVVSSNVWQVLLPEPGQRRARAESGAPQPWAPSPQHGAHLFAARARHASIATCLRASGGSADGAGLLFTQNRIQRKPTWYRDDARMYRNWPELDTGNDANMSPKDPKKAPTRLSKYSPGGLLGGSWEVPGRKGGVLGGGCGSFVQRRDTDHRFNDEEGQPGVAQLLRP